MTERKAIDVSRLPVVGFGWEAPIWWGQLYMAIIEGTLFAMLIAAYLYARMSFAVWPPPGANLPDLVLPTAAVVILLLSCIPMYWGDQATHTHDWTRMAAGLILNWVAGVVYLILRIIEWRKFDFSWSSHLYGSLVWALLGLHTAHVIGSLCETLVLLVILAAGHREEKLREGLNQDEIYWYFVVISGVLLYATVHLVPRLT